MPVDPHDILDLARAIGKLRSSDEAARRSAASRAYHAAFHAARLHVWRWRLAAPPGVHGTHQGLIEALASSPDPADQRNGYRLRQVRDIRHRADYDIHVPFEPSEVRQALREADDLVRRLTAGP
ncbi:MAG TPA: hypothetical protein ENK57_00730 [Polyangiaceae bacterium]|nr:hypothetical protein [Polyangiaceae bacterium]